jgi:hypothetical protein
MYLIHNHTDNTTFEADAIETIRATDTGYAPAGGYLVDGFNAFVYRDGETIVTPFAFDGRTMHGTEPTGSFEEVQEDDEADEEEEEEG